MSKVTFIYGGAALLVLCLAGFAGWIFSLPPASATGTPPPVPWEETDAILASLRPEEGKRPLIAIIGINDATETTDYLVPTGILRRANVADVVMVATGPGPVQLFPALRVEPDTTIAAFDRAQAGGADYVIVPAMSRDDDPVVMAWLKEQSQKGATIIGVCAGAKVVGAAGLLDGRRATTHWYYRNEMLKRSPTIHYVADRRMVSDKGVVTTTGITASMPMMLTLIEAIAGRAKAESVARDLGLEKWNAQHFSNAFGMTRPFAMTVLLNRLAFWNHEEFGVRLEPGVDEVSLALVADAWSRTYRSRAVTLAAATSAVETANGIRVLPDRSAAEWPEEHRVSTFPEHSPKEALDLSLRAIGARYGERTTDVVAMQLEYPRSNGAR
jgi:transcriptional regulator GlxA family with amidase domain